jgi:hypothetical protein
MPSARPQPRWWFLITPRWLAWHAFAVLAAWGMLWLGDWQFHRAIDGNPLSWAYTFEWPIFTIFGVIFWAKTIVDGLKTPGSATDTDPASQQAAAANLELEASLPDAAHTPATSDAFDAAEDPELAAYNAYLAGLSSGKQRGRFSGGQPGGTQPTAG